MLSVDERTMEYFYYDQHHELSKLDKTNGTFQKLDDETISIESGDLKGSIMVVQGTGIKLIYTFDENKTSHVFDLKKSGDTVIVLGN